jgi:hypothetical protein
VICTFSLLGIFTTPAFADTVSLVIEKPLDVNKQSLVKIISNLKEYKNIFPDIKSIDWIDQEKNIARITAQHGIVNVELPVKFMVQPDGKFVLEIQSGSYQGSRLIMTLTERSGFDGTPNAGTTVKAEVTAKIPWFESLLIGESDIKYGLDKALLGMSQYANEKYPQVKNPTKDLTQKEASTSQIKSEKKVTTKELVTAKKTDLKKEAAQKLDPKKEAEKKLKQKDTGISEKQKSDLAKQIQTSKEKVEKTTKQKEGGYAGVSGGEKTNLEEQLALAKRKVEQAAKVVIPHIILDPLPSSVNAGSIVTFSGTLYLSDIPQGAIVYIKDEDPFDSDDLLVGAYVQSNGKFSVNWIARNVDVDSVADIYAVFEGLYPNYPRLATCDSSCTDTIKLRIN